MTSFSMSSELMSTFLKKFSFKKVLSNRPYDASCYPTGFLCIHQLSNDLKNLSSAVPLDEKINQIKIKK